MYIFLSLRDSNLQSVVNSKSKYEPNTDIFSLHEDYLLTAQSVILEVFLTALVRYYWEGLFSNLVWSFRYSVLCLDVYSSILGATSNERSILIYIER